jgi:chromosome segregation protein
MRLSYITLSGFKSFAKKTTLDVTHQVTGVVGPNGSGKSNIAEAIRFVLGEQSMKSMRSKIGADVIFKGSEHLAALSRASVTMVIDNRKKDKKHDDLSKNSFVSDTLAPYLVYDELTLSRTIYGDGTSEYTLNDAKVRLKDVQELLSYAGIGGSAHTIINQGEADKILLASPKDRKEALEDALGLRVYHMRLQESSRKLEKVKTHVREVELLRNEIKPHLQHLERQVKKIESQEEERQNLHTLLVAYFHKEDAEVVLLKDRIYEQGTSDSLFLVVDSIKKELVFLYEKKDVSLSDFHESVLAEKNRLEAELRLLLERKDQVTKTLGRLEGEKAFLEEEYGKDNEATHVTIPVPTMQATYKTITTSFEDLEKGVEATDFGTINNALIGIKKETQNFFETYIKNDTSKKDSLLKRIQDVTKSIEGHEQTRKSLLEEISSLEASKHALSQKVEETQVTRHEEEKKSMLLESKLRELQSTILLRKQEESELALRTEHHRALLEEGVLIIGKVLLGYKDTKPHEKYEDTKKYDLMRAIERSKLRIEEAMVPNKDDIITEYKTTKERDEYLTQELADIKGSEEKLLILIEELRTTLSTRFSSGIEEVSKVFSTFFSEVFIGGKAKLTLVTSTKIDDEGITTEEQGIELDVSLPNKKVKEIGMFSGGERALVSIALLFAMSSITPPPFMVLDETDAPLDESNARKYGAMLKRLAENSKLLVITHNRETMNHCDMLYGVTIGVDGGSKLLSINFKEAEKMVDII